MPKKNRAPVALTPKECDILTTNAEFTENEIREWHAAFLRDYPSGQLDKQTFINHYQQLHPNDQTNIEELFDRLDINEDGSIDFNELLVLIAIRNRFGNVEQRLSFIFDLWDDSEDGQIDLKELTNMLSALYDRLGVMEKKGEWDPKKRAKEIIAKLDISGDKKLSKHEFVTGCMSDPVIRDLLMPDS